VGQVRKDFTALTRMSRLSSGLSRGPTSLNRAALERCLAMLSIGVRHPKTRGGDIRVRGIPARSPLPTWEASVAGPVRVVPGRRSIRRRGLPGEG